MRHGGVTGRASHTGEPGTVRDFAQVRMKRDFERGWLEISFPAAPFDAPLALLRHAAALYVRNLPFLATVTLAVFVPLKFGLHILYGALELPTSGALSYFIDAATTFILAALTAPAAIYGLLGAMRGGETPPPGECLRWGRRQWLRTAKNNFIVQITIMLWGALLVVPGLIKMTRLMLVEPVVAIEGDRTGDAIARSAELSEHHRWKVFAVMFPLGVLDLAASFLVLQGVRTFSWTAVAAVDCVMAVCEQFGTVAMLLMYLGLARPGGRKN